MTLNAEASAVLTPEKWTPRALLTIIVLGACAGVQLSDQGIQSLSLSAIQRAFGVGDAALGAIQGLAGFFVGSLLAIPLSRLVDKFSRKLIFLCLVIASTSMMILSALAPNFELFFIGRSSAGILEFAMIPLVYSMIPDLSPERDRVLANLGFAAIMAAGASGGYYFGHAIIEAGDRIFPFAMDAWRKGFLLISISGLPLFLLGLLTLDPPRYPGLATKHASDSFSEFLRQQWKTIVLFVGVAGFLLIAVQALNQLIALAMERRFDASMSKIGQSMGVILLFVSAGSIPAAGLLDRVFGRYLNQARASRPAIMAIGTLAAIPATLILMSANTVDHAFMAVGAFLFVTATANALVPTMLQDLTPAALRARSFAIWSFLVSIFSALGPLIAGVLSEAIFNENLLYAITVTTIPALCLSALFAVQLVLATVRDHTNVARRTA
ncbi:MAG: MFS transporter [Pseudomonadota bacterium]